MTALAVFTKTSECEAFAKALAEQLQVPIIFSFSKVFPVLLVVTKDGLQLQLTDDNAPGPIFVDFLSGALAHRRQYGGGKGQLIAKAVGVKSKETLTVLDVTAGLGRDAFVLALLGCNVWMCERSPVIHALLADGLHRAKKAPWFQALSLTLIAEDSIALLEKLSQVSQCKSDTDIPQPDVIYCDPMFPDKTKSALVKKEMRVLRAVVGDDLDANVILEKALLVAKKRVVVKRAKLAPTLTDRIPDLVFKGKSSRFDVYFCVACPG